MDTKVYISSGILEEYALGLLGDQERREVECMSKIYPEVAEALTMAESDLEKFAAAYAVKPPADLKARVMGELAKHSQDATMRKLPMASDDEKPVSVPPQSKSEKKYWGGWAAAAAIVALALAVWQFSQNTAITNEITSLTESREELREQLSQMENRVAELSEEVDEVYNPDVRKIVLEPVEERVNNAVALFWNTRSGAVKIDTEKLPALSAEEQYQLWVIKDGVPVDMGVLPKEQSQSYLAANTTQGGEAFAITIEPLGGKESPSLDRLVVMGNIG